MDVNKKIYMWIDEKIIDEKSKTKHAHMFDLPQRRH